jgi:hypothetical protein
MAACRLALSPESTSEVVVILELELELGLLFSRGNPRCGRCLGEGSGVTRSVRMTRVARFGRSLALPP